MDSWHPDPEQEKRSMIQRQLVRRGISDQRVLQAMRDVPRHRFIPVARRSEAYGDFPVAIGYGQTMSQPYMVALMTELLEPGPEQRILEIGTGSGYQAAILACLAHTVYSVDRIAHFTERARKLLYQLGIINVKLKCSDGTLGWPEYAPFDGILVTAGAPEIPVPLTEQLVVGGKIVIPVGSVCCQELHVAVREEQGFRVDYRGGCVFVKLIGQYGWS